MSPRRTSLRLLATLCVLALGALTGPGFAQDLTWSTIDGGGGTSSDGVFTMSGTIGQPDAGTMVGGGSFEMVGGYWGGMSVSVGPPCPGDHDGSGDVGFGDLLGVLANWGPCPGCPEDVDGSGAVDFGDLLIVLSNWGSCPE